MNIVALARKSKVKVVLSLGIWSIFMSLFCNIDSYLYMQIGQFDSAVFFMCGKSLMNGMIPYEEFTDSKGILLWLFYGVGYLIDHYSYVGVFWIMCGLLYLTLCIAYRLSTLFLPRRESVIAALMLFIPLLYWNFYFETKAEHFCWPAVLWCLYVLMKAIREKDLTFSDYVWVGVCIVYCLFIKWSVAVMNLSFFASLGWIAWKRKNLSLFIKGILAGFTIAILPLGLYFTVVGNWQDMWQEYFVNTLITVSKPLDQTIFDVLEGMKNLFTTKYFLYLIYTLPVLYFWNKNRWFTSALPALCGLFFIGLCARAGDGIHYITIVGPFAIMTIIVFLKLMVKYGVSFQLKVCLLVLGSMYVVWGHIHYSNTFCTKDTSEFNRYMSISSTMAKASEHPKIIIIGMEPGLCMGTALPGTRYWTLQKGRTEQMWQDELSAIHAGTADYIVLWCADRDYYDSMLVESGYHFLSDYFAGSVYTRHEQSLPSKIKTISISDILTKKNYTEIYR